MLQLSKIKYKPMNSGELFRALDRLTRFKHPRIKYRRVFCDILINHLIEPKLNLKKIEELDDAELAALAAKIWNESADFLSGKWKVESGKLEQSGEWRVESGAVKHGNNPLSLWEREEFHCERLASNRNSGEGFNSTLHSPLFTLLKTEDSELFFIDKNTDILLNTNLNISGVLSLQCDMPDIPINLQRLFEIKNNFPLSTLHSPLEKPTLKKLREENGLKFPLEKIILCEGITEEILLPVFADILGYNFNKKGVHLISAGGKNQIARRYTEYKDSVKIPIFILLDEDAKEIEKILSPILQPKDKIHLIKQGEFEDILSKKTLQKVLKSEFGIPNANLSANEPMCKILTELLRINGAGDFKKADFAKKVKNVLNKKSEITAELVNIVNGIRDL